MKDLTQKEIEELHPEAYTNFLAFGDPKFLDDLDDEEYRRYLLSHLQYDM